MLSNEMMQELEEYGDLPVLMAKDAEGNGYNFARGLDVAWVTRDLESLYDSLEEAEEDGYEEEDLTQVALVFA